MTSHAKASMCKPLADYMTLINFIREKQNEGLAVEQAVDEAVKQCIEENVLCDFLTKHRAEVMDVCLTEYNEKVFINGIREEGLEEGLMKGREEGLEEGLVKGEKKLSKLIGLLLSNGRVDDAQKVVSDDEVRKQFYREYGITD